MPFLYSFARQAVTLWHSSMFISDRERCSCESHGRLQVKCFVHDYNEQVSTKAVHFLCCLLWITWDIQGISAVCFDSMVMQCVLLYHLASKVAIKNLTSAIELKSLPLTADAFEQSVYRAHFEVAILQCALDADPTILKSSRHRWSHDQTSNIRLSVPLPLDVSPWWSHEQQTQLPVPLL